MAVDKKKAYKEAIRRKREELKPPPSKEGVVEGKIWDGPIGGRGGKCGGGISGCGH